jgi:lysophospholipase L1-like esterase
MGILVGEKMDTKDKNLSEVKRIAFFGDSLTEGFPGASYFEILKKRLPNCNLLNYGKGGDTVISLYQRLKSSQPNEPVDIAFLWVGVNDVFVKISSSYPIIKILKKQPWVREHEKFEHYYHLILEILCQGAKRIITVPPLFMGEDINNSWNKEIAELSGIIEKASASYENVEYLDLRKIIFPKLKDKKVSEYLPESATRVALDVILLKQKEQYDKKSSERGLLFTLDGVHLNSRGAEIVANIFLELIKVTK